MNNKHEEDPNKLLLIGTDVNGSERQKRYKNAVLVAIEKYDKECFDALIATGLVNPYLHAQFSELYDGHSKYSTGQELEARNRYGFNCLPWALDGQYNLSEQKLTCMKWDARQSKDELQIAWVEYVHLKLLPFYTKENKEKAYTNKNIGCDRCNSSIEPAFVVCSACRLKQSEQQPKGAEKYDRKKQDLVRELKEDMEKLRQELTKI